MLSASLMSLNLSSLSALVVVVNEGEALTCRAAPRKAPGQAALDDAQELLRGEQTPAAVSTASETTELQPSIS